MAYDGTNIKDLVTTTPTEGTATVPELNDSDREIKIVLKNQFAITTLTTSGSIGASDSLILFNHASVGVTATLPTIGDVSSADDIKWYYFRNINTATGTIGGTVDGVSNPTLANGESMTVYGDGTTWRKLNTNATNAENATNADTADALLNAPHPEIWNPQMSISPRIHEALTLRTVYQNGTPATGQNNTSFSVQTGTTSGAYYYHDYSTYVAIPSGLTRIIEFLITKNSTLAYGESLLHISNHSGSAPPSETQDHFGFKIISGTGQIWASNAEGTTQTSTDCAVVASTDASGPTRLTAVFAVGSSIKFYVNGTLKATHTTNLPDTANFSHIFWGVKTPDTTTRGIVVERILVY